MITLPSRLQNIFVAERAVLRHLVEHAEDRVMIGSIIDPSDFLQPEHQQICAATFELPLTEAGNHVHEVSEALLWHAKIEALGCFETLGSADILGSWMVALQVSVLVLLHASYRKDAEALFSLLFSSDEEGPW